MIDYNVPTCHDKMKQNCALSRWGQAEDGQRLTCLW